MHEGTCTYTYRHHTCIYITLYTKTYVQQHVCIRTYLVMCVCIWVQVVAYACLPASSRNLHRTKLPLCMLVCIVRNCICTYIHIHTYSHTKTDVSAYVHTYTCICIYMYMYTLIHMYTYVAHTQSCISWH